MLDSLDLNVVAGDRTLGNAVFQALRDAVIDGRLQPGQWLRQEALAQELGLSQMPVREALNRLVAEGLAERIPYRGVRVVDFSPEDIVDVVTVRLVMESLAVRFATPNIQAQELAQLRENLRQASECTTNEQMPRRRELNTEFHLTICRASGRRYLVGQLETLWGWFPAVMLYEGLRRQEALTASWLARETAEHWAILIALERRDPQLAEEATRQHIGTLASELADLLGVSQELVEMLPYQYTRRNVP